MFKDAAHGIEQIELIQHTQGIDAACALSYGYRALCELNVGAGIYGVQCQVAGGATKGSQADCKGRIV